jgi:hypothetical protein
MEIKKYKKVIFRKDKFEKEMLQTLGQSEFLLFKLNTDNYDWAIELDNKDISKILQVEETNGEEYFVVSIMEPVELGVGSLSLKSKKMVFIMPRWCDIV